MSIWLAIALWPPVSIILGIAWAANNFRLSRNYPSRNHGEGDGVGELGVRHGQSNYNNLGAE